MQTNKNKRFANPFSPGVYSFPTLSDLIKSTEKVIDKQGFDDRLKNDYLGSIRARLNGLVLGAKGAMLNTPRSINFSELLHKKVIIELENRINLQTIPRILGLISESILNVWVEHNKLKVKGLDIKYIGTFLNFRMALTNNRILVGIYRFLYFKVLDEEKRVKLGHFIDGLFFNKLIK